MAMLLIKITYEGKIYRTETKTGTCVEDAVRNFGINPLTVLIKVNGNFIPDDEKVKNGDKIELIRITSIG